MKPVGTSNDLVGDSGPERRRLVCKRLRDPSHEVSQIECAYIIGYFDAMEVMEEMEDALAERDEVGLQS